MDIPAVGRSGFIETRDDRTKGTECMFIFHRGVHIQPDARDHDPIF